MPTKLVSVAIGNAVDSWSARIGAPRVEFGVGALDRIEALVEELGGKRLLIVTDPGIREAGHVARALDSFAGEAPEAFVFDEVEENPTTRHVNAGTAFAAEHDIYFIVGLGGGSAMDCAKGIKLSAVQRRQDGGLLGAQQGHQADACRRSAYRQRPVPAVRHSRSR